MAKASDFSAQQLEYDKRIDYAANERIVFIKALFDAESPNVDIKLFQTRVINRLLSAGVRLQFIYSALHFACHFNNINLVKYFVERGWNVNSRNSNLETLLHILLRQREVDTNIVDYLISNDADVDATDYLSFSILEVAIRNSHISALRSILQHPYKDASKCFPTFFRAVCVGSVEILETLLDNGYNINVRNSRTSSLFETSCKNQNPYITLLLLQGSNFATPDSVLDWLICHMHNIDSMHPRVVELLLALGMKRSSIKLLSSYPHKEEVTDYHTLTNNVCTLKQLSRIVIKDMFYSKWSHLSINEIMKNLGLPVPICKYLRYKTENIN